MGGRQRQMVPAKMDQMGRTMDGEGLVGLASGHGGKPWHRLSPAQREEPRNELGLMSGRRRCLLILQLLTPSLHL